MIKAVISRGLSDPRPVSRHVSIDNYSKKIRHGAHCVGHCSKCSVLIHNPAIGAPLQRTVVLAHKRCLCVHAKSLPSCPTLSILWTVAHQAPLFMGFSRQEHCSGLPCPPPGDLPDPGIKPRSLKSLLHCRQILYC